MHVILCSYTVNNTGRSRLRPYIFAASADENHSKHSVCVGATDRSPCADPPSTHSEVTP